MKQFNLPIATILTLVASLLGAFPFATQASEEKLVKALALSNASSLSEIQTIYKSKDLGKTVESSEEKATRVAALGGSVVGENRLLFEITFAHPPDLERATFCLYLDLDNDPGTGRTEGAKGVDLMVMIDETQWGAPHLRFCNPDLSDSNTKMLAAWEGGRLYITIETPLPKRPADIRAFFLSSRNKGASNSSTPAEMLMKANPSQTKLPPIP